MHQGEADNIGDITLLALGGNVPTRAGPPAQTLQAALGALEEVFGPLSVSHLYQTPAFPEGAGPDFVNAACTLKTGLAAPEILAQLHRIEADFDRTRAVRWGQRTLDLDLIACGGQILPDRTTYDHWRGLALEEQMVRPPDQLILPHPRLQDRAFVLVPLADVAPDWRHPVLGQTVRQMRDACSASDLASVRRLS
ncbi:2-amino-4-hydroxy-6-hydroxymethyldihydropteridine diphosphokinase [Pseudooctadecabacter jejudonensis]|uniref:2-amino-4-hydroxy-6-hydroxymethyldihydropteridine pyrophosphokinase n=1 Tax=Pseudooctadecabacter jejudonensis TaxID=1391910 RepID=A0A1Y5S186_9RHOB|nr:2-amino-4-hydroxy-6-hydroxymethyldihydropteridine diphosphokinase [Pseudooctadecabacter jejudonensis]SLN29336.1 2-amino-4-hydroxy-6-hydroxymethyldihydropteridinepyrophosphokinase [Pseudooctadecabacter jejudonensis]